MSILPASSIGDESTGFYNNAIDQSLRCNQADNNELTFTPGSNGDAKHFTMSAWVKKVNITTGGGTRTILGVHQGSYASFMGFNSSDVASISLNNTYSIGTTSKFRDVAGWYHVVWVLDADNGTAANRLKCYINGEQQTLEGQGASADTIANTNYGFGQTNSHSIGGLGSFNGYAFDGYLAEVNFLDGQVLDPTYFAETKNGVWIPKKLSGLTYGTNGFRITFEGDGTATSSGDVSTPTNIGDDSSGNNNHFAVSGFVSSDVMSDSPENNFCTLNPLTAGDINDMSQGALQYADNRTGGTGNAIATYGLTSGKWYWEVHYDYDPGASNMIGIVAVDEITGSHTATDAIIYYGEFFGWDERGYYYVEGGSSSGKTSYVAGDIISFALDVDAGKLFIRKNNSAWEDSGDPANGTNPSHTFTANTLMSPMVQNYRSSRHVFNFGQNPSFNGDTSITAGTETDGNGLGLFKYAPPTGYLAICSSNLPDTTISPSKDTQADDHFGAIAYSGSASNQTITLNFQADWLWFKERTTNGIQHQLFDSSRLHSTSSAKFGRKLDIQGTTRNPEADSTAIVSQSTNDITLLGGVSTVNDQYSRTYVMWHWKANGGTTSSNTDGDITSTVQANTDAGFSIVTYTGTGTSTDTVGHGLGAKPKMVIVRSRSEGQNWHVYHEEIDATAPHNYILPLNANNTKSSSSSTFWGGTAPTTTVMGVGSDNSSNKSSQTYVMYCFAEVEGYSKFGQYTGNSSADGKFVYTGFRPAYIMVRKFSGADDWVIHDNARSPFNVVNGLLTANSTDDEFSDDSCDFLSNGFKWRLNSGARNTSGQTYLYMAFAEQPFKFSNAR